MRDNPYRNFASSPVRGIFGVVAWRRTWTNLLYVLTAFPLGLLYFILLVVAIPLGLGLLLLGGVGAVILLVTILAVFGIALFERQMAIHLLGAEVAPVGMAVSVEEGGWPWLKAVLSNPVTWKGLFFEIVKFPLGLASWIVVVVLMSLAGAVAAAPIVLAFGGSVQIWGWWPATPLEALPLVPVGALLLVATLHVTNGLGWLWGLLSRALLGRHRETGGGASPEAVPAGPALPARGMPAPAIG